MKLCAICGTACANADPTCPNCGEASWILGVAAKEPDLPCKQTREGAIPSGSTAGTVILDEQVPATVKATEAAWTQPSRRDDRHHNRGRR